MPVASTSTFTVARMMGREIEITERDAQGEGSSLVVRSAGKGAARGALRGAARLQPTEDLDTFLDAAALLRDHRDIALLLVGDGVEKQRLQARAAREHLDNVRFMPFVPAEAYPEVVASADVCLVSLQKSLRCPVVPAKLLGYMAAGRAIVASFPEGGDAPKLVREARCGISVPAGHPKDLAAAILEASRNPEVCRTWGERGRAFAVERHDREKVMSLYESLFGQLARATVPPAWSPTRIVTRR